MIEVDLSHLIKSPTFDESFTIFYTKEEYLNSEHHVKIINNDIPDNISLLLLDKHDITGLPFSHYICIVTTPKDMIECHVEYLRQTYNDPWYAPSGYVRGKLND